MTAADLAAALGPARQSQWWWCVCPAHGLRTGRSRTLALRDGDPGPVLHCHGGRSRDEIIVELRRARLLAGRGGGARLVPVGARGDHRTDAARRIAKDDRGSCYGGRQ